MERIKNSVRLIGYAGSDPVISNFAEGKRMAKFNIGVHEFFKNSVGEPVDQTQWFQLIFWNQKVDLVEHAVKKGTAVCVEGKLNAQTYKDRGGEIRYYTEVVVLKLELVDKYQL